MHTSFTLTGVRGLCLWLISAVSILYAFASTASAVDDRHSELRIRMQTIISNGHLDVEQRRKALLELAADDHERAWLLYSWVTGHFKHDARMAALIGDPSTVTLDRLFQLGGGSCAVFANVFHRLMQGSGLAVKTIYGLAKGEESSKRLNEMASNHVWNLVKIGGVWYLMDATWGAGYVALDGFHREQTDLFFKVPLERAVLSHFDPADQLEHQASLGVDYTKFKRISDDATYAAAVGFDVASILQLYIDQQRNKLVTTFNSLEGSFKVIEAPLIARLNKRVLRFRIESSEYEQLVVIQGKTWTPMLKYGNSHSIEYEPSAGVLTVMARRPKEHVFEALLVYSVQ